VLTFIAVALALGAVAVGVGWWLHRADELGRPRRFPWVSVVVLAALAVAAAAPGVARASQERRLGVAATVLAGVPVAVHCQRPRPGRPGRRPRARVRALAGRRHPGGMGPHQARPVPAPGRLRALGQAPAHPRPGRGRARAHPRGHAPGRPPGEAGAECAAVQRDAHTARLLGAGPADAAGLAAGYWRGVYPLMPERYRSEECRGGGPMDEGLADAPWLAPPGP
jgi:hypothetical protein